MIIVILMILTLIAVKKNCNGELLITIRLKILHNHKSVDSNSGGNREYLPTIVFPGNQIVFDGKYVFKEGISS